MGGFQTTSVMQRSSEKTFVATEHWFSVCVGYLPIPFFILLKR
ncbi:hypothetical protein NEIMUCOT_05456 [Neisseria mucosa ATCC 25996]|uniref:Uncharacterized protein n=1 Tax=Neisseria mucosa (strain ATCC 25996 / DSM 4631 / NCTC 10774 / M26) TaxID=546266 RepID=D2ZXV2_NEIM2|nr:hypothetical protein NEIMUCOT_05456 [Neisseria mucosa ATCC 25996]